MSAANTLAPMISVRRSLSAAHRVQTQASPTGSTAPE